jgi:hypothetical protein
MLVDMMVWQMREREREREKREDMLIEKNDKLDALVLHCIIEDFQLI